MRRLAIMVLAGLANMAPAMAAELVMFEQSGCPWCVSWDREIAPAYTKSPEGRTAPLRRVNIKAQRPTDLTAIANITGTPIFVLMDKGTEIGRINGYPGPDFFWPMLDELLEKLPPATPTSLPQ